MNSLSHIIDPEGEVIITLRNANSPFAKPTRDTWIHQWLESSQTSSSKSIPLSRLSLLKSPTIEATVAEESVAEGHLGQNCSRIQVSAKHLMFASPFFKRLLTGGWKESVAYFQKGSVEITAESWDVEALMIMLAKIAAIADYYECREALDFLAELWIEKMEEETPSVASRDLILWLWVSWVIQLPTQFKLSTSIASSQSDGFIDNLGLSIPEDVIVSINRRREEAIERLIDLIDYTRRQYLLGARGCRLECRSIMYGALTIQSKDLLLPHREFPFPNVSYRSLVQKMTNFRSLEWYDSPSKCINKHSCPGSSFASTFGALDGFLEGLELEQFNAL
ncbi:hypothetical protein N7539_008623 [Penicillium diatomitis]|uniref:BTB domain-containing protein n=1 Tax=Penicillium diatomitis TaxID=2819901 RepID=A0A9W9WR17_9EURO|nr:uncharacterized protein N7539_008623 [Penicillium diatomitis]KAJ5472054.1 hypothetical protein N7539_008623 [Penicillium diatomitis]